MVRVRYTTALGQLFCAIDVIRQPKRPIILTKKSVWDQSVDVEDKSLRIWDQTRSNHHLTFWKSLSLIGCGTNLHNFMLQQFLGSLNALLHGLRTHEG